ncbi:MarR family transcriptional regulator [Streptomyces sp. Li-HN-5-11]|uniref:MarR family winged helix-turn-helix transcriptional regulator n=1 Tax=Streptomyces sp. Li-HN-5-11 TaxID=3075432 RepID=UPI0028ACCB96|nr:MarR family transcriptional regulator [Streptomyces sp. Li-HN-5-11]WNM31038.1 MarR family transcriptional regulator [Streptomyces sp. Li-HN-5-11]
MNAPDFPPRALGAGRVRIGPLLRHAQRRAARTFSEALRPLGIEGRHYGVLLNLGTHGPLSQRRLIDLTREDKSSMVRTVDDLEARGLAVRRPSPTDRRAYAVEITEEGRALFARASVIADEVAARLLDCLSDQDQELLCSLLERFVAGSDD